MPIRITGMNSGLDTESIISEMVKAQKTKSENIKKKQTSLQWKQDAWKELNSKIFKLFNGTLSGMRFAADYSKKTTDVSDSSFATIVTSDKAMNTSQSLEIKQLAASGYMTGDTINGDVKSTSKLTELGIAEGSVISITAEGKTTDIKVTADMTVDGFVKQLQQAGVEASFDEKYKRLHIAAKKSGAANDFTITAGNSDGTEALKKLGILTYDDATMAEYEKYANMSDTDKNAWITAETKKRLDQYIARRTSLLETKTKQEEAIAKSKEAFQKEFNADIDDKLADPDYKTNLKSEIDTLKKKIEDAGENATQEDKDKLAKLQGEMSAVENYEKQKETLAATNTSLTDVEKNMTIGTDGAITASAELTAAVTGDLNAKIAEAQKITASGTPTGSNVQRTKGQDATIVLNGIEYKGDSNTFEINGLTITALKTTPAGEKVTLTTRQDTDGIYDKIKAFLAEYNALINEMDKLYNAESSKGYDPLSDEEKDEMTDSEIEKWEKKIKDSIMRRDSNLSTVSSAMKTVMLQGVDVGGEMMYLSDFGIETLGWFNSEENEKNAYHINGDEDDSAVSSKENTLKAAIAADPQKVADFFSGLANNLYTELDRQSRSIDGVRSFGKFYDDKRMQDEYNSYAEKIKKEEQKLTAMEDRWYNKFAAMETALARLQQNQSAISGLFGGM